jgi:hypothetical protein
MGRYAAWQECRASIVRLITRAIEDSEELPH